MAKSILIRQVPDAIHLQLKCRAQRKGQPLQQYLLNELTALAERPTMEEVLERISSRDMEQVDMETILRDLDDERSNRM